MGVLAVDLRQTTGFAVADRHGRLLGRVECPLYGTRPDEPDALAVRERRWANRRRLVPAAAIERIDRASGMIDLRVERETIRRFL